MAGVGLFSAIGLLDSASNGAGIVAGAAVLGIASAPGAGDGVGIVVGAVELAIVGACAVVVCDCSSGAMHRGCDSLSLTMLARMSELWKVRRNKRFKNEEEKLIFPQQ